MLTTDCHATHSTAVHTLVGLLQHRKTRRFGYGMELPAGPLAYRSKVPPMPLSAEEVHHILFAGVGETGVHLGDMQYARRAGAEDGQGMAIMGFQGRTSPSACAANATKLFMSDDNGLYFVDMVPVPGTGMAPRLLHLQDGRLDIPRALPFMLSFNQWYANRPGTLYLVPVTNVSTVYLNLLFSLLSDEYGYFIVDTDQGSRSCGLDRFRRSKGGHLYDDPAKRRTMTLRELDTAIAGTALQEQGAICQNMFLMIQAMGLGGGIHSVGSGRHLLGWEPAMCRGLGFHFGASPVPGVRSNPVGHPEAWRGALPPFVSSMTESVLDLLASKFGAGGSYGPSRARPWTGAADGFIAPHDDRAVEAVIAFCDYVYTTYGRFPAHEDAFKTVIAFQAHHVDEEFYGTFYPKDPLPPAHRNHRTDWHAEEHWIYDTEDSAHKEGIR
ncbi:hypothetical protein [Nitrospira sp. Nam80]